MNKQDNLILDCQALRNCDRIAIEKFGVPGIVLMENAARNAATLILSWLKDSQSVCIVAGSGNNAGDGFALARHLYNAKVEIEVACLASRDRYKGDALVNLDIISKMPIKIHWIEQPGKIMPLLSRADFIIDAMLGTGSKGQPRGIFASIIEMINATSKKVIALDTPSGMDCDSGTAYRPTIIASETITFAALKKGFEFPQARNYTGNITLVDIGIATELLL